MHVLNRVLNHLVGLVGLKNTRESKLVRRLIILVLFGVDTR